VLIGLIDNLKVPVDRTINNMQKENEGLSRQNNQFLCLYRKCLTEFRTEVEVKNKRLEKQPLDFDQ
jgi:hypothetical protein